MVWHARLLGMWIYISNRRMKPRQRRDCNHTKRERRDEWKVWKLPIYERSGWKCEICGEDIRRGGGRYTMCCHTGDFLNWRETSEI